HQLIDYDAFCGIPGASELSERDSVQSSASSDTSASLAPDSVSSLAGWGVDAEEAAPLLGSEQSYWLDVREAWEFKRSHIPGSIQMPLDELPDRMVEIPKDRKTILVCENGQRSGLATEVLRGSGYPLAFNLAGGLIAWRNFQLPLESSE